MSFMISTSMSSVPYSLSEDRTAWVEVDSCRNQQMVSSPTLLSPCVYVWSLHDAVPYFIPLSAAITSNVLYRVSR